MIYLKDDYEGEENSNCSVEEDFSNCEKESKAYKESTKNYPSTFCNSERKEDGIYLFYFRKAKYL